MTNQDPDLRQSKKVLICDSEPKTRQALKALLLTREVACHDESSSMIHVVGEARDGWEAVQLAKTSLPQVVVIDACMPGMDSLAVTRLIKKNWPQIRVVVLTMYAGADTFLMKGCLAETLFEAILA